MGLLDDLKMAIGKYENALSRLNEGDYFRIATMDKAEWDSAYLPVLNLSKDEGYLDQATRTISQATAESVKSNDLWRGNPDPYGGGGFDRALDSEEADDIARYMLQVINDPRLEWLMSKSVLDWNKGERDSVVKAIGNLKEDVKRVADKMLSSRKQYYDNGPALDNGESAESVLAKQIARMKSGQLENYLTGLLNGNFDEPGYELYNKLVLCAEQVFGTQDSLGRIVPRSNTEWPWLRDEEKVAKRILEYNFSTNGGKRPSRYQVNQERVTNVRNLEDTLGLEADAVMRRIGRGEGVSPRQLAAGALHVDNKIFNIMLSLKQRVPANYHVRLDQAVMSGNEDSISDVLFSSTRGDAEDSIRQAMDAVRLRQDAIVLADRTKAMKDQDYNLYMEFLYYYLGCSEDEGKHLGVTPFWEQDSVLDGKMNEVSSWYMARQSRQGRGGGLSGWGRSRAVSPGLERAMRQTEDKDPNDLI